MAKTNDYNLMYKLAKLYHVDGISQIDISRQEGLSRSTVSRLLDRAKTVGIVNVSVCLPPVAKPSPKTSRELCRMLGLKNVIIAPTSVVESNSDTMPQLLKDVATTAAANLPRLLKDCHMVGLGWGRSVHSTAAELPFSQGDDKLFVPMVNNFTSNVYYLQTSAIVSRFCEKFNANGYYLNIAPMHRKKGERTEDELASIRQLAVYWDALDAAVLGFSSPEQLLNEDAYSAVWRGGMDIVSPNEERLMLEAMGQVLYEDGSYFGVNRNYDMVSMDLQRLKEIKNVICIAAGTQKAATLVYAAKGRYYKTLITDSLTAELMLEIGRESDI